MKRGSVLVLVMTLVAARAAVAEDREPKNVKHLTGLTPLEMQRTMNFMRAALGVHCDHCHVVTEKDGWQWERDDKAAKVTARRMIAMVQQINRDQFAGKPVVSCFTCHGGHRRPESLPPLPQPAPPFPTPAAASADAGPVPSPDALWQRFREAIHLGEPPATRVLKGKRVGGAREETLEIHEKGARIRMVSTTPRGTLTQVLDGAEGWMGQGTGTRAMEPADRARLREVADALAFPPPPPRGGRVAGKDSVEGRDAWAVEWTPAAGRTERLYFDVESGLLVRRAALTERSIGVVPERIDYLDYREVGGARVPATFRTAYVDPWTSATRTFTEVQLGAPVDDAVFTRPPEAAGK